MTKFSKLRVHGGPLGINHGKRDGCSGGGFYKNPTAGQQVQAGNPLNLTWDPTCMSTTAVDIYLYQPTASNPRIHLWETVDFAAGYYETQLNPKWWNSTSSVNLQLAIVQAGQPPFMATLPAGPIFTATYSAPAGGVSTPDTSSASAVEVVNNVPQPKHGLSKGKVAAAVIMPLLIIAAIIAGVYIKLSRQKVKDKRKRFSEMVDRRMSTVSTDWKSITPAGAQAAIRASMAVGEGGNRASSFSFGAIRPLSTVADGGHAGIGAKGVSTGGIDTTTPQMSELRAGPRAQLATGDRVSRVSFAADTRPSGETRRSQYNTRTSRAFHNGHVPPLPQRQDSGELSPTQAKGPLSLSVDDINARMSGMDTAPRPSVDEMMPALTMMRTGGVSTDDLLLQPKQTAVPPMPSPPPAAHQIPKSSIVGVMPMQPMPASVMSPDEMLRAYAERRGVASPPPVGAPALPAPVVNYNSAGMRTLYSPSSPDPRLSFSPTEHSHYSEADVYGGTA